MARDFTFALPRRDQPDVIEQIHIEKGTLVYVDFIGMCKYSFSLFYR